MPDAKPRNYVVVARRYRPQGFADVVGQDHVAQALRRAIETNRVGHAYLFTGARGVGKTSMARIFAKALNCTGGPSATPPPDCEICRDIARGEDVDVLEIDGASNRGIDEIRQLRSNVNVRPSRARFKVYIIDEVHMLTTQAFNALLKTLEEPPEHVKFIFCTTDPEKIPITVLSRCQRFDFAPVDSGPILERLEQIVAAEGRAASREALELIARRAAGSVRDSQSLLEQLLAFAGERIELADVHAMLGTTGSDRLMRLVECMLEQDAASALAELDAAAREGTDSGALAEQFLSFLRDLLVVAVGGRDELLQAAAPADRPRLSEMSQRFGVPTLLAAAQILDQALVRMRQSTQPRLLLEIALVRLCHLERLEDLRSLVEAVREGLPVSQSAGPQKKSDAPRVGRGTGLLGGDGEPSRSPAPGMPVPHQADSGAPRAEPGVACATGSARPDAEPNQNSAPAEPVPQQTEPVAQQAAGIAFVPERARELWDAALGEVGGLAADLGADASGAAISGPNVLAVTFPPEYNAGRIRCEQQRPKLEEALRRLTGQAVRLELHGEPGQAAPARPSLRGRTQAERMHEAQKNPFVRQVMEMFEGNITEVRGARRKPSG